MNLVDLNKLTEVPRIAGMTNYRLKVYSFLLNLAKEGNNCSLEISQNEIAEATGISPSRLSETMKFLETKGFIKREYQTNNNRKQLIVNLVSEFYDTKGYPEIPPHLDPKVVEVMRAYQEKKSEIEFGFKPIDIKPENKMFWNCFNKLQKKLESDGVPIEHYLTASVVYVNIERKKKEKAYKKELGNRFFLPNQLLSEEMYSQIITSVKSVIEQEYKAYKSPLFKDKEENEEMKENKAPELAEIEEKSKDDKLSIEDKENVIVSQNTHDNDEEIEWFFAETAKKLKKKQEAKKRKMEHDDVPEHDEEFEKQVELDRQRLLKRKYEYDAAI